MIKDEKKKAKDQKDVQAMLDDVCLDEVNPDQADKKQPQENSSEASESVVSKDQ